MKLVSYLRSIGRNWADQLFYEYGYSIRRIPKGPAVSIEPPASELISLLHAVDPYEGFDFLSYTFDPQGWFSQSPVFADLIASQRPELIIEVGTWKGASAMEMASQLRKHGLPKGKILCIDTWLGAVEFWTNKDDPDRYKSLMLKNGYPTVYYQFLANVVHKGFQDTIIPFPQTSATAALWLKKMGVTSKMIYIDGSHEEHDVDQDLCDYWDIVTSGGVIFGDDYNWGGVKSAVDRFARRTGKKLSFIDDKWILRKS